MEVVMLAIAITECTHFVEPFIPGWNLQANVGVETWTEKGI